MGRPVGGMPKETKLNLKTAAGGPIGRTAAGEQGQHRAQRHHAKRHKRGQDVPPRIRTGGAASMLKGIEFNSFGAFFSRAYRENDYLWGRLHGADRLIDIVASSVGGEGALRTDALAALKRRAFHAILDEEEPRLPKVAALIAELRGEIG